jgi:hypothetical protein
METNEELIKYAMMNTHVLRAPSQKIATFGITNIKYYIITEPIINEILKENNEDWIIREGKVIAEKPQIITPFYLNNLFHGFEHGEEYTEFLRQRNSDTSPGLLYKYRNDFKSMTVVSETIELILERLEKEIDESSDNLTTIIKGFNACWDVSLMKFIFELTTSSLINNITDLNRRGLLNVDNAGIPRDARMKIENLFKAVKEGKAEPGVLKKELDCWGVFDEYERRFLDLFVKK